VTVPLTLKATAVLAVGKVSLHKKSTSISHFLETSSLFNKSRKGTHAIVFSLADTAI
jgi:hypothetical protein